jgi:uncharacterized repeat protein (TIGR01451 family)
MARFSRLSWAQRALISVLLMFTATALVFASTASADAGNPIGGTIKAKAVDNGDGTVTIGVKGEWNWLTHSTDCNVDRAGTGVAIVWNDPTEPGWTLSKDGITVGLGVKTLRAGDTVNRIDRMVHPTDVGNVPADGRGPLPGAKGQVLVDPTPDAVTGLGDHTAWRSGCGRAPADDSTIAIAAATSGATESGTTVTLTSANPAGGFRGYAVGDHVKVSGVGVGGYNGSNLVVTGKTDTTITYTAASSGLAASGGGTVVNLTNPFAGCIEYCGSPWGSWGYQRTYSHTYLKSALPSRICVNFYDVHGDDAGQPVGGAPNKDDEIQVDASKDNSIQTNAFDVSDGANCVSILASDTATTIHGASEAAVTTVAAGSTVHDSATVTGVGPGAGTTAPTGDVTFDWFTNGDCAGSPASTSDAVALAGGVAHGTGFAQGPLAAGSYSFKAHYDGDRDYIGSNGPCEPLTVVDARIALSPLTATNAIGDPHTFTAHVETNAGSGFANAAAGTVVSFSIAGGPGSLSAPSCTTVGTTGSCTVTLSNAATAGRTTLHASTNVTVGGIALTRATGDGKAGDGDDAVKTWVDAYITIDPAQATNQVNIGDDYTAHVFVNDGTGGYVAAPDGTSVSFSLRPGAVGTFTGATTCTTTGGACTIPTTSGVVGDDVVRATTTVTVDGDALTRATGTDAPGHANGDDANKHWVAAPPAPAPAIAIVKGPKQQSVTSGETAMFTITVTNTGNVTLTNVRVSDAATPGCDRMSAAIPALASMEPNAWVEYICSQPNVTAGFTNIAVATGTPAWGPDVTATDSADVIVTAPPVENPPVTPPVDPPVTTTPAAPAAPTPPPAATKSTTAVTATKTVQRPFTPPTAKRKVEHPSVAITKSPDSQSFGSGGTAAFTIRVANTGDVKLHGVRVADPRSKSCNRSLGSLAPGASVSYTCSKSHVKKGFVNVARVSGKAPSGKAVHASDRATVHVTPARIATVHHAAKKPAPRPRPQVVSHVTPKVTG